LNLSLGEALNLLNDWKKSGVVLQIRMAKGTHREEFSGKIEAVKAACVDISGRTVGQIDLKAAEFNGGSDPSASSKYSTYLVCEFPNGDRCSFYLARTPPK
jgi:hypothetical protein